MRQTQQEMAISLTSAVAFAATLAIGAGGALANHAGLDVEFHGRDGERTGHATLREGPSGVVIRVELDGLQPGWKAIHIHQTGDCHDHHEGFQASGGHLDPDDHAHGLLNADGPEIGDLANIHAHDDGTVRAELHAAGVRLDDGERGLLRAGGTALVVHEGADDHSSQPIGGAGDRVACAVIRPD